MPPIPRDPSPDGTPALTLDPYGFIGKRCRRLGTDLFQTRLLLQETICLTGPDAARLFYDPARFVRAGAPPGRLEKTLFGRGGVQSLDGEAHRHRKRMFLALMAPGEIDRLAGLADRAWAEHARRWESMGRVVLYDEARAVLTRAVCTWAGVPLPADELPRRARQLTALFQSAGAVGPRHWWGRVERRRADRWAADVVGRVRTGALDPPEESVVAVIARHRDADGKLLDPHAAGVELLNVLRPTVAVAVYVTFLAHALHAHPKAWDPVRAGEPGYAEGFVHEVRRLYPFFPAVAARVREDFEWRGYPFPKGTRVILDLYGTNRDPRAWDAPDEFRPERFTDTDPDPFAFVPQGGGGHEAGHRCAGEWATVALMKGALDFLASRVEYDVPDQDLRIDMGRLPALPRSRFVLGKVRAASPVGAAGGT